MRSAPPRPAPPVEHVADGDEVAQELRHLLAVDVTKPLCSQKRAMSGAVGAARSARSRSRGAGRSRSMPPPWMSKVSPRCFAAIAEHSMCQPGPAAAPGHVPARLVPGRRLPQHEIHRVALVGRDLDPRAGDHLVERAAARGCRNPASVATSKSTWPRPHRRGPRRSAARSSRSSAAICSVARGSTVGGRQPSAATSSWNCAAVAR